jgi:hypothetical protein
MLAYEERYLYDSRFHALVESIREGIVSQAFSVGDYELALRLAAGLTYGLLSEDFKQVLVAWGEDKQ